ncbi:gamma-glutamyltransferase [Antarcticibacterium flavum]|uniref:Glutathione hydrolase proenzyme n=1 Tax=Antarcticibacterium flavum TaxID=2058175 RepID=A0A5B7X1K5_9FLAO|nr:MULTISPECIES: gamma-glutamyltransferase [Antarcticibacterium]MCM4158719.1 gamma-glutamyltransferase [Antarcticibacterium sp. W02-3]QCY68572.1 gamma-glutamyltransferase [Antarcticibacterium flavum]
MKFTSVLFTFLVFIYTSNHSIFAQQGRIPARADSGMVVTSHYLASQVGNDILAQGGNAIDATVATAFALAVTLPSAGNIGGGGFIVYKRSDGEQTAFNFREKAPLAAHSKMFLNEQGKIKDNSNHEGLLSVGVPGTVAGLYKAHQKMGSLPWEGLLNPAIELAEGGFPSTYYMTWFLEWVKNNKEEYASTARAFLKKGEEIYNPGETWRQPELAETLKRIRDGGADGFYKGETARLIEEYMKANGGLITREDLEKYEAEEVKPITGTYRDYEIISMPPPSSGGVALIEMLNILEGFDLRGMGHNSAKYLHTLTEAMRRAYADRALHLGDPNFNENMPIDKLISKDYATGLRNSIKKSSASVSDSSQFSAAHFLPESPQTTHISVVDRDGNAVSMTYTLEASYGSRIVVEGAGFLLNNEMGDFNPIPGYTDSRGLIGTEANLVAPEKRMLSSMTPTIVARNGKPVMVIGSPGGRTIINTVLQVILNVVDHELDIAKAIESPRIHHQWLPDRTSFERWGFSPDTVKLYEEMGHSIRWINNQGQAMGIFLEEESGIYFGAADSRSYDGRAIGF